MILSNSRTLLEDIEEAKLNGFTEEFIFNDSQLKGRKNNIIYNKSECELI
jgi:hypothetical protein